MSSEGSAEFSSKESRAVEQELIRRCELTEIRQYLIGRINNEMVHSGGLYEQLNEKGREQYRVQAARCVYFRTQIEDVRAYRMILAMPWSHGEDIVDNIHSITAREEYAASFPHRTIEDEDATVIRTFGEMRKTALFGRQMNMPIARWRLLRAWNEPNALKRWTKSLDALADFTRGEDEEGVLPRKRVNAVAYDIASSEFPKVLPPSDREALLSDDANVWKFTLVLTRRDPDQLLSVLQKASTERTYTYLDVQKGNVPMDIVGDILASQIQQPSDANVHLGTVLSHVLRNAEEFRRYDMEKESEDLARIVRFLLPPPALWPAKSDDVQAMMKTITPRIQMVIHAVYSMTEQDVSLANPHEILKHRKIHVDAFATDLLKRGNAKPDEYVRMMVRDFTEDSPWKIANRYEQDRAI